MITAKEAYNKTIESNKHVSDYIDSTVHPLIANAIDLAKFECFLHIDAERVGSTLPEPVFYTRIVSELKNLGYNARICWRGDPYLPRSKDPETSSEYDKITNYGISISWNHCK